MRRDGLCLLAWLACASSAWAAAPDDVRAATSPFDACTPPATESWTQERLLCLYRTGRAHGLLSEARARLERLGAGQDAHPWATLALGYATQEEDELRAVSLYEIAARGFARVRDAEGEVLARYNIWTISHRRGDIATATHQVARAREAAEASRLPLPIARAAVLEANDAIERGADIGGAYRTLRRAEQFAFPDGPIGLRRMILMNLANASFYLGRLDDAIDALERHRALRRVDGSTVDAATVLFNLLNARLTRSEQVPRRGARERLLAEAREVLSDVKRLNRPALVARTHRVLADLLRTTEPEAASTHLTRCLEIAATLEHPSLKAECLWTRSLHDMHRDPTRAERASREALQALAANPEGPLRAYAWQARLRLVWQTMPEEQAVAASRQALDAIEGLRTRQEDDHSRAALFSNWTRDYYWLAGRLLDAKTPRLSQAFDVGERLRARVLLEHLERAGLSTSSATASPASFTSTSSFASIEAVQQELGDGEALLWYSIAPWVDVYGDFGGGAWLVCLTRETARVHRLATSLDLQSRVSALVGLLRDRDVPIDRWDGAASRLGITLLGPAIAALPSAIQRLIIVSDGDLHRLPFEALRHDANASRLGERFEIAIVPSATLWLRMRRASTEPATRAALVLADPDLDRAQAIGDLQLAPLPWARREARAVARTLRLSASDVREGRAASERRLKDTPLGIFGILHLAAHARAEDDAPDRSAVFLAPGSPSEDGWLQPREIAALNLRGRLVVLSACDSASGFLLSGEGPLSLARAFFAAGAGGVVATRWPLRDDDAAFVMEHFYRALGSGVGAGAALRHARRDAIADGRPAAVWAGVALLGEGRRPPLRAGTAQPAIPTDNGSPLAHFSAVAMLSLILLGGAGLVFARIARPRTWS